MGVRAHSGVVHDQAGWFDYWGQRYPRPRCGIGRNTKSLKLTDESVTCKRCLAMIGWEGTASPSVANELTADKLMKTAKVAVMRER